MIKSGFNFKFQILVSGDLCLLKVSVCPPWPAERTDPVHIAAGKG